MAHERPEGINPEESSSGNGKKIAIRAGAGVIVVGVGAGAIFHEASRASAAEENGRNWYQVGTLFEKSGFDGKVDPIGTPSVHKTKGEVDTITGQVGVEVPNCSPVTYSFKVHPNPTGSEQAVTFTQPLFKDEGGDEVKVYPDVTDPKTLQEQAAAICAGHLAVISPSATPKS